MKFSRIQLAALAALFAGGIGYAAAQVPPTVGNIHQNDLVPVVPYGTGSAQSAFAPPGQVAGVVGYSFQVPLTGFTITVPHGTADLILNPAGTLATGTITLEATPNDGQRFCWVSTATQTAVTITAGTGQTLAGAATETAGVANTPNCRTYVASNATWYHSVAPGP